jgi:hypothetical protein
MTKISYDVSSVERGNVIYFSDIEEERLQWFWRGYIPFGKVTVLDGDPGLGKSTLALNLAARFSQGAPFPDDQPLKCHAGMSLIVSGEDDIADTIKPRLRAAGANMNEVATLALRKDKKGVPIPFSVPEDMPLLVSAIRESDARFVVIDPISAFLSSSVQSHNDASVRQAMSPLTTLAQETGSAFLLLRHLTKETTVAKALYRGGGSIGFSASARSVLLAAPMPDGNGVMVLARTKANLSRAGQARSLQWRVVSWKEDPEIAAIEWLGPCDLAADDLLRQPDGRSDPYALREAMDFLRTALADGPLPSKALQEQAEEASISESTLKRAKSKLDVHSFRERSSDGKTIGWFAHLPDHPTPENCDLCRRHQGVR